MGEDDEAMHYDPDVIFKHLYVVLPFVAVPYSKTIYRCFYIDSPGNAKKNGMPVQTKLEEDIARR